MTSDTNKAGKKNQISWHIFQSTSEKKSCFKVPSQMPQKFEISTPMRDEHVDNSAQAFFSKPSCLQASVAHRMQSENRAKEIPMCDFILNGGR